jgi:hypothetical protein
MEHLKSFSMGMIYLISIIIMFIIFKPTVKHTSIITTHNIHTITYQDTLWVLIPLDASAMVKHPKYKPFYFK